VIREIQEAFAAQAFFGRREMMFHFQGGRLSCSRRVLSWPRLLQDGNVCHSRSENHDFGENAITPVAA